MVAVLLFLAGVVALFLRPHARKNLLLVTIDTLRADHLGAYGDKDASTPTLDALARRGVLFENAHTVAPLTGPSHATILTGVYPPVHGVRDNATFVLGSSHPALASVLKSRGYTTAGFVAALPLIGAFGFSQGFDTFSEEFHADPSLGQEAKRPGNEVVDAVLRWLGTPKTAPFFAWVHLYDPHAPYAPPPPFLDRFRDRPYDGEIAFADAQVGRILEALSRSKQGQETLVAVLADHGEGLGEHGEKTHAVLIYESTLRIPFILAGPGVPSGRVVKEAVGSVDVVPTLLGLLGVEAPAGLPGRDLRPALLGRPLLPRALYSESLFGRLNCRWATLRGLTEGPFKLIDGVAPELYDLEKDPGETQDLAGSSAERVTRMRNTLGAALKVMAPAGDRAHALQLSPEQEERLRSL
ncbi:MAG TPA: sulfatase, partial [Vicinamibacteria bacterium]|nr:sulfatase [Vicinamibacteria bacterium]